MVNLTYDFYKDTYCGSLDNDTFNKYLFKSKIIVSNRTNKKIDSVSDDDENKDLVNAIKCCMCEVIDKFYNYECSQGKVVSSQSSGKTSESYAVDKSKTSEESDIASVIKAWLEGYGYTNFGWI